MMELRSDINNLATGFILESKLEKGRGPVATVICKDGTLHVGDFYVTGHMVGKISSLMDSYGKQLKQAGPSVPVQIAGFSELPKAGDFFEVVSPEKYHDVKSIKEPRVIFELNRKIFEGEVFNIIVKADSMSTFEALLMSINKTSEKASKKLNVIYSGVGNISESDVILAADTGSEIFGLHVKIDLAATAAAQKNDVTVHLYDIIYKLIEFLEEKTARKEQVKLISKKIGEAIVRKVFDIKGTGVIAGCYMREGRFTREGNVVIWRGKKKIGQGAIRGLERDRKSVKEVHAGFEFAFLADGFDTWEIDDRVECFINVPESKKNSFL